MPNTIPSAEQLKAKLLQIYKCREPFELLVFDRLPKTRMGVYIVHSKRIRVYSRWSFACPLIEIAIHEYAHHIHRTENFEGDTRGRDRSHGEKFWRIYSALMAEAKRLGIYDDELIHNIIR